MWTLDAIRDAILLLHALLSLTSLIMSAEDAGFKAAVHEARQGSVEGGVPIGACLVSAEGKILGQGHNMRIQKGSATLHVSVALIMHACALVLTGSGRNLRLGKRRASSSLGLPRRNHVHQPFAL